MSLPPPPIYGAQLTMVGLPYSVLFLTGILGNTAVLTYVFFLTRSLRSSVLNLGNTFLYIAALSVVDLLVVTSIPLHMTMSIMNNWIFGEWVCKFCSTFILSAMAFDRYMAICHPQIAIIHTVKSTVLIIAGLLCTAVLLVSPVVFSSKVVSISYHTRYFDPRENKSFEITGELCTDGLQRSTRVWVSAYVFLFGFAIPGSLLCYFYANMVFRLRKQTRANAQSRIPIRRVLVYAMVVTAFYFVCQMPFWLSQLYGMILSHLNAVPNANIVWLTYFCHMFPFAAAALNWIFYAQLNTQFRKGLLLVSERNVRKHTARSLAQGNGIYNGLDESIYELNGLNTTSCCEKCGQALNRNSAVVQTTKISPKSSPCELEC